MKTIFNFLLIFGLAAVIARAQDEVPPPMPAAPIFTDAQLQQLLGPIALYPDPLIAIMLPAATFPTQIVMADRYVSEGGDPNQIDQQPWDPNVQALAHYPAVLKWMDDNLNWTTQLGEAFQNQQQDVMTAVQELRTDAYNLGNLQSTPQQQVVDDNGYIEIVPGNPDNVYVPEYQPNQVYYVQPYGTPFVTFSVGYIIGPWLCGDFDWRNHHLLFWDRDHPRPAQWWHERPDERDRYIAAGHARVWNPGNRGNYAQAYDGDRGYDNHLPWTSPPATSRAQQSVRQQQLQTQQRIDQQRAQTQQSVRQQQLQTQQRINQQRLQTQQHIGSPQPPPNNAFIGIQSAQDTRDYSNRGEHSMQTMPQFRDLGGFHGGNPPPAGGVHGGAPAGGGNRGGGGGRGNAPPSGGGGRH
jgi:hypothetical protein